MEVLPTTTNKQTNEFTTTVELVLERYGTKTGKEVGELK